jgi:hypothetical protein
MLRVDLLRIKIVDIHVSVESTYVTLLLLHKLLRCAREGSSERARLIADW